MTEPFCVVGVDANDASMGTRVYYRCLGKVSVQWWQTVPNSVLVNR